MLCHGTSSTCDFLVYYVRCLPKRWYIKRRLCYVGMTQPTLVDRMLWVALVIPATAIAAEKTYIAGRALQIILFD